MIIINDNKVLIRTQNSIAVNFALVTGTVSDQEEVCRCRKFLEGIADDDESLIRGAVFSFYFY